MTETSLCDGRVWLLLSDSSVGIAVLWTTVVVGIDAVVVLVFVIGGETNRGMWNCESSTGVSLTNNGTVSCCFIMLNTDTPITNIPVPSSLFMFVGCKEDYRMHNKKKKGMDERRM